MARTEALHSTTYELSYASINWIRFEGSPCHAFSRATSMASQPPQRGSPSFIGEKSPAALFSDINFVAGGKKRGFCRLRVTSLRPGAT